MTDYATINALALQGALRRIAHAMEVHSRRIDRELGLTLPQLAVLTCVRDLGEVTSRAIARAAHLSPPTVAVILDKLELKGMIRRERSHLDRRIVHARMTEAGHHALLAATRLPEGAAFQGRFARLPEGEQRAILTAIEKVAGLMEQDAGALHSTAS